MSKFISYIEEAYDELLHKVKWPSWLELQQSTIITLVTILLLTVVVFTMDGASEFLFKNFYGLFN
jgi:preprotein translocase subunit SecE